MPKVLPRILSESLYRQYVMSVVSRKSEKGSAFSWSNKPLCISFFTCFARFFLWLNLPKKKLLVFRQLVWQVLAFTQYMPWTRTQYKQLITTTDIFWRLAFTWEFMPPRVWFHLKILEFTNFLPWQIIEKLIRYLLSST